MIHFLPDSSAEACAQPYAEAVARLAGIRQALRLVDPAAAGDPSDDQAVADAWAGSSPPAQRLLASRCDATISSASAGIETVLELKGRGFTPNPEAMRQIADEMRRGLADLERAVRP